ncbi:hypothetical protein VTK26DRAFT_5240 [Humicola hyalothermophila]
MPSNTVFLALLSIFSVISLVVHHVLDMSPVASLATSMAVVLFLYSIVWLSWIHPRYFSPLRIIPTAPGFPLWGQFFEIITTECGVPQRRWHKELGPIVRYFFPFGAERLSIADDEALKYITKENYYNFPKPVRAKLWMERILGEGVLLAESHAHQIQRKALAPAFSVQAIKAITPAFWNKALFLGSLWHKEVRQKGENTIKIEILEWINRCTLDIIGEAGFGYEIGCLDNQDLPIRQAYRLVFNFDLLSRVFHGLQAFFPFTRYIPTQANRDMETARGIIIEKATSIMMERLHGEDLSGRRDILSMISRENDMLKKRGSAGLSQTTIRDQIMTFLGAGHDTTATAVVWTLHQLSIHGDVQSRLRDEIRAHMPFLFDKKTRHDHSLCNAVDVDQLSYLDNVCRESLRHIPPIPMTVREVATACKLGPYAVPSGTVIYMLANAINRLPAFWGDTADKFDPDRWDNLPETAKTPNAFMTFLHGPRGCIGRKFAEVEMKVILCSLLSMYEFRHDEAFPDPEQWKMWRLVLRPKHGIDMFVTLLEEHRDVDQGGEE